MLYGQEDEEEAEVGQSITDAEAEDAARARADLELVAAAYPDEVQLPPELDRDDDGGATAERELKFPILFTLRFDPASTVQLEIPAGYPTRGPGLRVASYRSNSAESKLQMELAVSAIRKASLECLEDGVEAALACCAAGLESWREGGTADLLLSAEQPFTGREESTTASALHRNSLDADLIDNPTLSLGSRDHAEAVEWISGDPIVEKKSVFQAHVCRISREAQVLAALHHLLDGNSKLQRATHNMVRSIFTYQKREMPTSSLFV
jgi:hypothetical protein